MEQHSAHHVKVYVTCSAANMGLAIIRAVIRVLHVLNGAVGAASTVVNALYPVALHATGVYAIFDARRRSHVVTSVQVSAEKTALHASFVISVGMTT